MAQEGPDSRKTDRRWATKTASSLRHRRLELVLILTGHRQGFPSRKVILEDPHLDEVRVLATLHSSKLRSSRPLFPDVCVTFAALILFYRIIL